MPACARAGKRYLRDSHACLREMCSTSRVSENCLQTRSPDGSHLSDLSDAFSLTGPDCSRTKFDTLPDDVLRVVIGLLQYSAEPRRPSTLSGQALDNAADVYPLAVCSKRLRELIRCSVESLEIRWSDPVGGGIVGLFAPGLRRLSVHRHMQVDRFIASLDEHHTPLTTLSIAECTVDFIRLADALEAMVESLESFSLSFASGDGMPMVARALRRCSRLTELSMYGVAEITDELISDTFCQTLRAVSLGYLRNASLKNKTLETLAVRSSQLVRLELADLRWCAPDTLVRVCACLAPTLRVLSLKTMGVTDSHLRDIASHCVELRALSLHCRTSIGACLSADAVVNAVKRLSATLVSLECNGISHFSNMHVSCIVHAIPLLEELRIANSPLVSDTAVDAIVERLTGTITVLEMSRCAVSDASLRRIGEAAPPRLSSVKFTACHAAVALQDGIAADDDNRFPSITDEGVSDMLSGIGSILHTFHLEYISDRPGMSTGGLPDGLSAAGIAVAIVAHCPGIRTCCLTNLRPPANRRVLRARADLAMIEMEESLPLCALYVDQEALPAFAPISWERFSSGCASRR